MEEEHWHRDLLMLNKIATDLAEHDLEHALPAVLQSICSRLELHFACLTFLDSDREELVWGWGHRDGKFLPAEAGLRFPASGLPGEVLRTRQTVRGTSASLPDNMSRLRARELGLEHFAGAPLIVRDRVIGMLFAGRREKIVSDDNLKLLAAAGLQIAVAADNARLLAETERRAQDLAMVQSVGVALARAHDVTVPMRETLKQLGEKFQLSGIRIYVLRGAFLECAMGYGDAEELLTRYKLMNRDDPFHGTVLASDHTIDLDPAELNEPARSRLLSFGYGRVGGVPLSIASEDGGQTKVGALSLVRKSKQPFARSELDLLAAVGSELAIALRNSELRDQNIRQERLAALGGMAALVAHEMRNPLGVIINSLGFVGKLGNLTGDSQRALGMIKEEAGRLERIVTDILDYTRPNEARLTPDSVDRVLHEAVESARVSAGPAAPPVIVDVAPNLPLVPMDDKLLHQAVVNLVANACQAVGDHGVVQVGAALRDESHSVRIAISDNGPGLTDEAKLRLFEPFFTTKAKGSGLGLAMVKRIVDSHRGEISVESGRGSGTRFAIDLPLGN